MIIRIGKIYYIDFMNTYCLVANICKDNKALVQNILNDKIFVVDLEHLKEIELTDFDKWIGINIKDISDNMLNKIGEPR